MSMLSIIVIGAGGHAKVLLDTLLGQDRRIIGIVDQDDSKLGMELLGIPVIGNDDLIFSYQAKEILLVNGIGSINHTSLRGNISQRFKSKGYFFVQVIHPSAIIAKDVKLAEGVQVMAGAIIQTGCMIGMNTVVNTKASLDHDCKIGANVHIAPGVTISGGVEIDDGAHVGTGAVIIQGIKIGKNSIIGAGSVVIRDVMPETTVIGVPGVVYNRKYEKK